MPNNTQPPKLKLSFDDMVRKAHAQEYEEAMEFKVRFQASAECKAFRKAWGIPMNGFRDEQSVQTWDSLRVKQSNEYTLSDKLKRDRQQVDEKRHEVCEKKITYSRFEILAFQIWLRIPVNKYEYDLDQTTVHSGQPFYWRHFIERCIHLHDFKVMPVRRPLPDPSLIWDNETGMYELIITKIFPNTTMEDFNDRWFKRKLREAQSKMAGYKKVKTRRKRDFEKSLGLVKADVETPYLSDVQKAEAVYGDSQDAQADPKIVNRVRQARFKRNQRLK